MPSGNAQCRAGGLLPRGCARFEINTAAVERANARADGPRGSALPCCGRGPTGSSRAGLGARSSRWSSASSARRGRGRPARRTRTRGRAGVGLPTLQRCPYCHCEPSASTHTAVPPSARLGCHCLLASRRGARGAGVSPTAALPPCAPPPRLLQRRGEKNNNSTNGYATATPGPAFVRLGVKLSVRPRGPQGRRLSVGESQAAQGTGSRNFTRTRRTPACPPTRKLSCLIIIEQNWTKRKIINPAHYRSTSMKEFRNFDCCLFKCLHFFATFIEK